MPKRPSQKLAQALRDNLKRRKQSPGPRPTGTAPSPDAPAAPPPPESPPES